MHFWSECNNLRLAQSLEFNQPFLSLQAVSANFTRSSSEPYSEIDKWAGNFVITFRSSEAISELRFEISEIQIACLPRNIKDVGEKT